MRLLKVSSFISEGVFELVDFVSSACPPYAILSHTWTGDEIQFSDVLSGNHNKAARPKIVYALKQAHLDGLNYAWVDTCCIDKSSSAELQEAINSMFLWYQEAKRCYVYLEDVTVGLNEEGFAGQIKSSRWFTRGWTLQELLAPKFKSFYTNKWNLIGSLTRSGFELNNSFYFYPYVNSNTERFAGTLMNYVSDATGIGPYFLAGANNIYSGSVAMRMSWAARRSTSRPEDMAYSLLGLFQVSMPLLYGEGAQRAFFRLQQEIMRHSDDTSIFLWRSPYRSNGAQAVNFHGLLATQPFDFQRNPDALVLPFDDRTRTAPFTVTNKGLQIELILKLLSDDIYLAIIGYKPECYAGQNEIRSGLYAVYLKRLIPQRNYFKRVFPDKLITALGFDLNLFTSEIVFIPQGTNFTYGSAYGGALVDSWTDEDIMHRAWASCRRFQDQISGVCVDVTQATRQNFEIVGIRTRAKGSHDWCVAPIESKNFEQDQWDQLLSMVFELDDDDQRPCLAIRLKNLDSKVRLEIQIMHQRESIIVMAALEPFTSQDDTKHAHQLQIERTDMIMDMREETVGPTKAGLLQRWSQKRATTIWTTKQYYVLGLSIKPADLGPIYHTEQNSRSSIPAQRMSSNCDPLPWDCFELALHLPLTPGSAQRLSGVIK